MQSRYPIVVVGGGPVGLAFALMLARRGVPCTVLDARTVASARLDRRLLALSRGTLDLLHALIELPSSLVAPIRTVSVSSAGQFGRVVLREEGGNDVPLGATVRYGDLLTRLAEASDRAPAITVERPCRVQRVVQQPALAAVHLESGVVRQAALVVNAEGAVASAKGSARTEHADVGLVADVSVTGPAAATAFERFTRDGPLALLPLPESTGANGSRAMGMVWCMSADESQRRLALADEGFVRELQTALGARNARIVRVGRRASYPLHQQARSQLAEHRIVHVGNAAQTVHPVAGQGLNLGMRDCAELADRLAQAHAADRDPLGAVADYARARRRDRAAILALTRGIPPLFATRAAPVAFGRSIALTALSMVPELRREFARLLMFGVRG
jgi:2-octaprenyl-6-methoxyphenol hydroxylase